MDQGSMLTVLDEPMKALLKKITVSTVGWDDLLDMEMPRGMSVNAAWEFVHSINNGIGVAIPVPSSSMSVYYRYSMELVEQVVRLYQVAAEVASLMPPSEYRWHRWNVDRALRDAACAARLDGFDVDSDAVADLYAGSREPESVGERLVANMLRAEDELAWKPDLEVTAGVVRECIERVTEGVSPEELERGSRADGLRIVPRQAVAGLAPNRPERERMLFDYINGTSGMREDFAFVRALITPDYIRAFVPGVHAATLSGRLIAHLIANKMGTPTLGMLALSMRRLQWERGELSGAVSYDRAKIEASQRREVDMRLFDTTMLHTVLVQIALLEAQGLLSFVHSFERRNAAVRDALFESGMFNQRQRGVLMRAAKGDDRTFTIAYHQANHGISYSTARRDFQELADRGFLDVELASKTQVFRAASGMDERLSETFGIPAAVLALERS